MSRFIAKSSAKTATPPGTLIHVGESHTEKVSVSVIDYDQTQLEEKTIESVEDCFQLKDRNTITWINVNGVHDVGIVEKLGTHFDIHPLTLEDIVHTGQRPKYDDHESYLYIVLKMLYLDQSEKQVLAEQVSLVLGKNVVISFQEKEGDVFGPIRERIRSDKGRIRKMKADYLLYALVDAVVDNYFTILESFGDRIEGMESEVLSNPTMDTVQRIHSLKREMIFLRKSVWPLRELANTLTRGDSKLVHKTTHLYLRDLYDHIIQVMDTIESFRDMLSGMTDMYLSSASNKMNEIMKVLTIFAAIFIPLTFIAGIYGMNFENMPELKWHNGYFYALGFMALTGIMLLAYFRKKKWM